MDNKEGSTESGMLKEGGGKTWIYIFHDDIKLWQLCILSLLHGAVYKVKHLRKEGTILIREKLWQPPPELLIMVWHRNQFNQFITWWQCSIAILATVSAEMYSTCRHGLGVGKKKGARENHHSRESMRHLPRSSLEAHIPASKLLLVSLTAGIGC